MSRACRERHGEVGVVEFGRSTLHVDVLKVYLNVVHRKVGADAELESNAATADAVNDDRCDAWRRLGLLRQVKRHLSRQDPVTVDVVLQSVDLSELRQVDRA